MSSEKDDKIKKELEFLRHSAQKPSSPINPERESWYTRIPEKLKGFILWLTVVAAVLITIGIAFKLLGKLPYWILGILFHLFLLALCGGCSVVNMIIVSGIIYIITKRHLMFEGDYSEDLEEIKKEIPETKDECAKKNLKNLLYFLSYERFKAKCWVFLFWLILTIITYYVVILPKFWPPF